ncbi:MAG: hypothetical protein WB973_01955 [Thermoanaerobaculia bacterium]
MEQLFGLDVPIQLWIGVAIAFAVGVAALILERRFKEGSLAAELSRDIGIAFIVAGIVSVGYEYSTRNLAERKTLLDTVNRAMLAFVPENVWDEVKDQIIRRNAVRRNVQMELRLSHEAPPVNGKKVALPPGQAVLWMSYGYDLYGLAAGESHIDVSHEVDYTPMWNPDLRLPRFDRVIVTDADGRITVYDGAALQRLEDGKGSLTLTSIRLPPPSQGKPVRIVTERYELVNTPGYYYLVMRELTAHAEQSSEPTVKIAITQLPSDIDADVVTFYGPHGFTKPDPTKNVWVFGKTLLPGQGLNIVFTMRRPPSLTTPPD